MISRADFKDRVRRWGLREDVVEKDYVLGWFLWGIGADPQLHSTWVLKGGMCLKKCYIETYRFSEDLDFTVLENGPIEPNEVLTAISLVLDRVSQESGIDFTLQAPTCRNRPTGQSAEAHVYYRGPRDTPSPGRITLDLTKDDFVARPSVLRPINHDYPDALPDPGQVRCYSLEEIFAEMLQALGECSSPGDLYDVVNLFRTPDFRQHATLMLEVLEQKCQAQGIPIPSTESILAVPKHAEMASEWEDVLSHQMRVLPNFDHFWSEVPRVFEWLDGAQPVEILEPAPLKEDEESWAPPQPFWETDWGFLLEPVRFAAINRLLVDLGYGGHHRLIEPYSLRRTRIGNILLHAIRADSGAHRSYRVDRIQSVAVTTRPFRPRYVVEFSAAGVTRTQTSPSRRSSSS